MTGSTQAPWVEVLTSGPLRGELDDACSSLRSMDLPPVGVALLDELETLWEKLTRLSEDPAGFRHRVTSGALPPGAEGLSLTIKPFGSDPKDCPWVEHWWQWDADAGEGYDEGTPVGGEEDHPFNVEWYELAYEEPSP